MLTRDATITGSPAHAGMHPYFGSGAPASTGFPRARGDAPARGARTRPGAPVPPRTRGCTPGRQLRAGERQGSPAHAGMHPYTSRRTAFPLGFPRARGDAPLAQVSNGSLSSVPPRTRGCTPTPGSTSSTRTGSPAHAGMHPYSVRLYDHGARFPRARGDAPYLAVRAGVDFRVPPRTRGCTRLAPPHCHANGGSPAHAGMHPRPRSRSPRLARFPRARGDAPLPEAIGAELVGVPPRTRGCTRAEPKIRGS